MVTPSGLRRHAMTRNRISLGITGACTATLLLLPLATPNDITLPVLVAGLLSFAAFLVAEHRRPTTSACVLVKVSVAFAVLAVVCPPHGSHDLWSYSMYGRILGIHHTNPYVVPPNAFVHDPFLQRLSPVWRGTRSVYGPLFTLLSTVIALVAGPSPLVARLLFQLVAAVAFVTITVTLARAGARPALLAAVAVNPLFIVTVVNAGHNDALVALGILAATFAAARKHPARAGVLIALAATVKISALLAAAALALWWWRRRDVRAVAIVAAAAALPTVLMTVAFGLRAPWAPLRAASRHVNGPSAWRLLLAIVAPHANTIPGPLGTVAELSVIAVAVVACVTVTRRRGPPSLAVGAALGAYVLATPYIMPWYLAWALPVVVAADSSALTGLLALDGAVLMLAAQYHGVVHPDTLDRVLGAFRAATEAFAFAAAPWLVARMARQQTRSLRAQ